MWQKMIGNSGSTRPPILTPDRRGALSTAIASSVLAGWTPDLRAVELLSQFRSGTIAFTKCRAIVVREAASGSSTRDIVNETYSRATHLSP